MHDYALLLSLLLSIAALVAPHEAHKANCVVMLLHAVCVVCASSMELLEGMMPNEARLLWHAF